MEKIKCKYCKTEVKDVELVKSILIARETFREMGFNMSGHVCSKCDKKRG